MCYTSPEVRFFEGQTFEVFRQQDKMCIRNSYSIAYAHFAGPRFLENSLWVCGVWFTELLPYWFVGLRFGICSQIQKKQCQNSFKFLFKNHEKSVEYL